MSDTPVKDGYYVPIEVKTLEMPADTTTDGKEVTPTSGSGVNHDSGSNVVNMTIPSGAAGDIKVNLTLTYPMGTTINVDSNNKIIANTAPEKVVAEYSPVQLDSSAGGGSFQLSIEFSNVTNITNLSNISTVINTDAKDKLESDTDRDLISIIIVGISQMKAAGENLILTLIFTVPISQFTGKDLETVYRPTAMTVQT